MAYRKSANKRKNTPSTFKKRNTKIKRTSTKSTTQKKPRVACIQKVYSDGRKVTISY